jgi:hypothetical protein
VISLFLTFDPLDDEIDVKDSFYEEQEHAFDRLPKHHTKIF